MGLSAYCEAGIRSVPNNAEQHPLAGLALIDDGLLETCREYRCPFILENGVDLGDFQVQSHVTPLSLIWALVDSAVETSTSHCANSNSLWSLSSLLGVLLCSRTSLLYCIYKEISRTLLLYYPTIHLPPFA